MTRITQQYLITFLVVFVVCLRLEFTSYFICFDFPFLGALTAFGTLAAVVVALIGPTLEEERGKSEERKVIKQNIKNELLINFETLSKNGKAKRHFRLLISQLELIQRKTSLLDLGQKEFFRRIIFFCDSARSFNKSIADVTTPEKWILAK